ncbi:uncharacterized protein YcbX [Allocatelliglobosispora scoriae]|uniref:Uncharacterized protein YcbX n=1 Tax=Allocatelliglobosispora scoriae TaxID=643052 RepID=A0A841BJB1_9ACTN|nr:MOSC domain-containing protein [Allocatelliglobosispora scoriae]MBB5866910.1 uncharacterized protein YcbX [Allocatelliglobosispora scoriae]
MGTVAELLRYPVKSMLGEALSEGMVTARGLDGDRIHAVLDATGAIGSAKHPRTWGALLRCRSRRIGLATEVELPDGTRLAAGSSELDTRLGELLGRPVTLSDRPPTGGALQRVVPDFDGGLPDLLRDAVTADETGALLTTGGVADGTFFDFGRLHLVTTSGLAALRAGIGDARRFRPNIVVDTGSAAGFPEDDWVGSRLRIGEAVVEVTVPTPRCAVPTLAHGGLPADPELMRVAARVHRVPVLTLGALTCVGVYLDVVRPGLIRQGDAVAVGE